MPRGGAARNLLIYSGLGGPLKITKIYFDPAGADTGGSQTLRNEMIVIKNKDKRHRSLTDWKVHDQGRNHTYRFGRLKLRPGRSVRLHTGSGNNDRNDRFWNLDFYVWNNDGDTGFLKNKRGQSIDRCVYGSSAESPVNC